MYKLKRSIAKIESSCFGVAHWNDQVFSYSTVGLVFSYLIANISLVIQDEGLKFER